MRRIFIGVVWFFAIISLSRVVADAAPVKVAVVKSWGSQTDVPVFGELNDNWSAYGTTPLTIDMSLKAVSSFTYQDLVDTGADVLFLSNPAGGTKQYSPEEIQAVKRYVHEGHSILGTYRLFQHYGTIYDNRALAPLFGLRSDIEYNTASFAAEQDFDLLVSSDLFRGLPDPYVTSGWPEAQAPVDDLSWDAEDLGDARLLARTSDNCGVITWYQTESYHAIYVSEMVEYFGSPDDTQFLYNALTVPEPSSFLLLGMGVATCLALSRRRGSKKW